MCPCNFDSISIVLREEQTALTPDSGIGLRDLSGLSAMVNRPVSGLCVALARELLLQAEPGARPSLIHPTRKPHAVD